MVRYPASSRLWLYASVCAKSDGEFNLERSIGVHASRQATQYKLGCEARLDCGGRRKVLYHAKYGNFSRALGKADSDGSYTRRKFRTTPASMEVMKSGSCMATSRYPTHLAAETGSAERLRFLD